MSDKITVRPGSGGRGYTVFWLSICVGSLMPEPDGRLKFHPYMRTLDINFEPTELSRIYRRLHFLRGWSNEQTQPLYRGNPGKFIHHSPIIMKLSPGKDHSHGKYIHDQRGISSLFTSVIGISNT